MVKSPRYRYTYDVRQRYTGMDVRDTIIVVSVIASNESEAEKKALERVKKDCYSTSYKYNADLTSVEELA